MPSAIQPCLAGLVLILFLFTGCAAGPGPDTLPQDVISGTVTTPAGYDVQGTELQLCSEEGEVCLEREIEQSGSTATFTFDGLEEGTYELIAFKTLTETSFLAGCHGTSDGFICTPASISPPQQNADIALTLVDLPEPPEPPPAEPAERISQN